MKKLLTAILIIALLLSICGCSLFSDAYDFSYVSADRYKSGNTEIAEASNLTRIHLYWYAGNVTIKTHDESSILVEETTTGVTDDDHKVHYHYGPYGDSGDSVLFIQFGKSGVSDYDGMQKNLTLTLPANSYQYIGITSDSANVSLDLDDYENMLEELTITSNTGAIRTNLSSADVVHIAGYSDDKGGTENRVYELHAKGKIYNLGMNSSYAKVIIDVNEVGTMESVGSVFEETRFTAQKADVVKLSCTKGVTYIDVEEFNGMDLEMREKPVYITLPADCEFTLNKTKEKVYDSDKELVSDLIDIGFENAVKVSDTKYTVGSGKKAINITTFNEIHIDPADMPE